MLRTKALSGCVLLLAGWGCDRAAPPSVDRATPSPPTAAGQRTAGQQLGAVWTELPASLKPQLERIELPNVASAHAIWGATGRDDRGNLYFGVSVEGAASARLLQYDPAENHFTSRGDVVSELRKAGVYRDGETQMKIHSKMLQADDGCLYFASMDETGERSDGSVFPRWGGHLWRMELQHYRWEHLLATKEALIAVWGAGRWVYALGYFNHVVYQFDTMTGTVGSYEAGSVGGHISRNLIADRRGHVYVPSVQQSEPADDSGTAREFKAYLLELDERLEPVQRTLLEQYAITPNFDSHGIVAFAHLRDGSCVFATSTGFLYRVVPPASADPAAVHPIGWFHPQGAAYASSLFTFSGERFLAGQAQRPGHRSDWISYDLSEQTSRIIDDFPGRQYFELDQLLIYGTHTRDDFGNCYLVGRADVASGNPAMIFRAVFEQGE